MHIWLVSRPDLCSVLVNSGPVIAQALVLLADWLKELKWALLVALANQGKAPWLRLGYQWHVKLDRAVTR